MQDGARTCTGAYRLVREDAGSQRQRSRWPLLNGSGMRGFTFIEVILALTILSFGLLAITGMFGVSTQALYSSGNRTKAILLAQEKLEELKNLPYHQLISAPMEEDTEEPVHTFQEERGSILLVWSVRKDYPRMGLTLLSVKATWKSSGGQTQSVSFVTLRTDLQDAGG